MKRRGIVKGQAIEFDEPIGLRDGQSVEIDIHPVEEARRWTVGTMRRIRARRIVRSGQSRPEVI